MRGQFDDHLRWPFRGVVEICTVDWCFRDLVSLEVNYNTDTPLSAAQGMFGDGEMGVGWGCSQSVPLKTLSPTYLLRGSPQYIENDSLLFGIYVTDAEECDRWSLFACSPVFHTVALIL